jgi:AraC-like DNA-binding protein
MNNNFSCLAYCFLLFFFVKVCNSQNNIKSLNDSVDKYYFSNQNKAKTYSHKLLILTRQNNLYTEQSKVYCLLADLSASLSQKDSAFYYYDKAIQKATEIDNQRLLLYHKINKANYLFNQFDFEGAMTLFNECLVLAQKNNDNKASNYILVKKGSINYGLGKYNDALLIFKKSLKLNNFQGTTALELKLSLAKTYLKLKEKDSAIIFINSGIKESRKYKLKEFEIHFLLQEGLAYTYKHNFLRAEKSFNDAFLIALEMQNIGMLIPIQLQQSKLLTLEKKYQQSIAILESINENPEKKTISLEYLTEIYHSLAENYKFTNNLYLSNSYYQKYILTSEKLGQKKLDFIDFFNNSEILEIKKQEAEQSRQKWLLIVILILFSISLVVYYFYKKKQNNINQVKFDKLIKKIGEYEDQLSSQQHYLINDTINQEQFTSTSSLNSDSIDLLDDNQLNLHNEVSTYEETNSITDVLIQEEMVEEEASEAESIEKTIDVFVIKDEKISEILEKLLRLEEKKYYLKQECSLHNVAKKLKTNTAYLSKIVNNEIGKSFSTYINELRINYIIIELKNNSKLRSYSINAIAEEIGYKSPESFTKYFRIATGISPSVYIKKINKLVENEKRK